ncbi:E3 ubiquitin-protein ligase HUWE1 isoform X3 [Dermacentor andersoni]|uniref:E3 ubiquitin-protein ligase HUWE1 isoform X3 n=1 Tax=Dermacentor andersoni TaxID=34620 RepID=UPI0024169ED1|nr:E3 ubiquitin-protein ligase HUWE1-like isoform X3 [Dermacentor andersoni]
MKIERSRLKKSSSEVPLDCKLLVERLKSCTQEELLQELKAVKSWNWGKVSQCELYHWIDVLDLFDSLLEAACQTTHEGQWCLPCDSPGREQEKELLLYILQFTALLIEHSFSRHLYNSMEHLTALLSSSDMQVVLGVLNLLYVFSKRSNFITRLNPDRRQALLTRLTYLAENWGGKENGFGLAECCRELPMSKFPASATTLHFEFYMEPSDGTGAKKQPSTTVSVIHMENVDKITNKNPSQIMEELLETYAVPPAKHMLLLTHVRLAHSFSSYPKRLQCVQARLQALSILVYCSAIQDNINSLLYNGLIEELVDVLELKDPNLIEIKAASLRTLTSIIHLDRNPKLGAIVDATGAASYHGFLPVLVRSCIQSLTEPGADPFPLPFATALFSFLYHLASYESGGEALVSCGMVESLLKVIGWHGTEPEHITFVTRAVRVIDLITGLDMQTFQAHGGLNSFIRRLELEVEHCRKEQPFAIRPRHREPSVASTDENAAQEPTPMEVDQSPRSEPVASTSARGDVGVDSIEGALPTSAVASSDADEEPEIRRGLQCFPQRAALLKSMLNFLKKAIQDPSFADSIRHLMDGSLPRSLKHIISNSEYYGPSLFLLATDVVTVYVFQEPSLLSSLQDNGLTDVVLHALLVKEVPATREVLASLPNVFSALCLNARGLQAFVACRPFERLFKVLLSPDYLAAMRRRRSSDPMGDTASNLGNAMDELMRHQPSLRVDATAAIIKLLEELCSVGRNPAFVCSRPAAKSEAGGVSGSGAQASSHGGGASGGGAGGRGSGLANDAGSSDEEEEEEDVDPAPTVPSTPKANDEGKAASGTGGTTAEARTPVPLVDYILNVMRFVDAILSNNSTDDHCREFVQQKGLVPLMSILGLPNLPVDFPVSPACQAVASVCKSILNLAHEAQVLQQGLTHLGAVLASLEPLHKPLDPPGGSVLLEELLGALAASQGAAGSGSEGGEGGVATATTQQQSPLLHAMAATHAYIVMFVHVCRTGQSEIRSISMSHWGSELGLGVLRGLSRLYTSLVWESTVLLALCNDSALPPGCPFGRHQLQRLQGTLQNMPDAAASNSGTALDDSPPQNGMEVDVGIADSPGGAASSTSVDGKANKARSQAAVKQIKPLLTGASRLGRALAELFGLLVKLCVGSPMRQRRGQQVPPSPTAPSPSARAVASALTRLLANGLSWEPPLTSPMPKFRLTFYICSVGFTSPMLFDERKYPYHLMLQRFLSSGGQDAFFETFRWALTCGGKVPLNEGLESPDLPEGTGEFLDAWLMLLEKMVNPRMVLESPHTLPARSATSGAVPAFSPVLYLIHTHKRAFDAIMQLWDRKPLKVYGDRMSESMLAILCHLLRGEGLIRDKLAKEKEAVSAVAGSGAAATSAVSEGALLHGSVRSSRGALGAPSHEDINQDHLQQLMDMGFCRELATEALAHSASLEQATDYLLSHPAPLAPSASGVIPGAAGSPSGASGQPLADLPGSDLEMSEEDQMMRAIAMSLGENVTAGQAKESDKVMRDEEEDDEKVQPEEEPAEPHVMDRFTENMLPGCLRLLDALPETVYRVCDLLGAVVARNGVVWRDQMLASLLQEVRTTVTSLLEIALRDDLPQAEQAVQLATLPVANMAAVRIHLFTLLFEEMRLPCATLLEEQSLVDLLVQLVDAAQQVLVLPTLPKEPPATPKWLVSLILLIDLYEKASVASKRRAPLLQLPKRQWKWFDDRTGRWNAYTALNNKAIDDAYCAVEPSVHFTAGRRKYTVQFSTMVQINEETGNWRPVMLAWDGKPSAATSAPAGGSSATASDAGAGTSAGTGAAATAPTSAPPATTPATTTPAATTPAATTPAATTPATTTPATTTLAGTMASASVPTLSSASADAAGAVATAGADSGNASASSTTPVTPTTVKGLSPHQCSTLIRSCVGLLSIPVEPDTLHGVLRLSLRLTRCHEAAQAFAALGGPRLLLGLTQASAFSGFASLASLLVRHVVEEPPTLAHAMDKVARTMATAGGSPVSSKELHYVLRVLGPAACRDPKLFQGVATNVLRISLLPMSKRAEEEESRYTSSNAVQILKCVAAKGPTSPPPVGDVVAQVMSDLLNVLPTPLPTPPPQEGQADVASDSNGSPPSSSNGGVGGGAGGTVPADLVREGSSADLLDEEPVPNLDPSGGVEDKGVGPAGGSRPFGPAPKEDKSLPLLPKSAVCRLLAELVRSYAPCARMVAEHVYSAGQTELVPEEISALGFLLDHLLPQCQKAGDKDSPALARVLVAALASANHSPDTQTTLVIEVKAALQRALALPETAEKHARIQALTGLVGTMIESCPPAQAASSFRQLHASMNNMVRVLLRRGLVTDLARIPHNLDLSSPHMAATVNSALKPLETLSRIVNLPSQAAPGSGHPRGGRKGTGSSQSGGAGPGGAGGPGGAAGSSSRTPLLLASHDEGREDEEEVHARVGDEEHREGDDGPPPLDPVGGRNAEMSSSEATNAYGDVTVDDNTDSESHAVPEEAVVVCSDSGTVLNEADGVDLVGIVDALLDRDPENAPVLESGLTGRGELALRVEAQEEHDSQMISQRDIEEVHQETTDSESNSDSGRSEDEVEQDEENEDEGDEEAEDEDEDEEEYQDLEEALFRMQDRDDNLFFHFEEVFPSSGTSIMFGGSEGIRTYQLPIVPDESNNGAETTSPSIPPPPGTVASTHPLLVRHGDPQTGGGPSSRLHRRTRGFRTQGATHGGSSGTWHVYANRHPNPPAILQRLLGPNTAQDILQLTSTFNPVASSTAQTRVVFANSDFRILATDEDIFEIQDPGTFVSSSGTGTLANIPTALVRWTEESRVLDGDSMHDCVAGLKPAILEVLERHRDEELAERREKRCKLQEAQPAVATTSSAAPVTTSTTSTTATAVGAQAEDSNHNQDSERTMMLLGPWPSTTGASSTTTTATTSSRNIPPADLDEVMAAASSLSAYAAPVSQPQQTSVTVATAAVSEPSTVSARLAARPPPDQEPLASEPGASESSLAGTERLAASIVERVLGPALSMTAEPATSMPPGAPPMSWLEGLGSTALSAVASALQQSSSCAGGLFAAASQPCPMDTSEPTTTTTTTSGAAVPSEEFEDGQNLSTDEGDRDTASPDTREAAAIVEDVGSEGSQQPAEEVEAGVPVPAQPPPVQRAADAAGPSVSNEYASILGDVEIPEGVDPSFLAALPENIRQEVIAEQLRLQRLRTHAQQQQQQQQQAAASSADGTATFTEVNPEFLAALPPSIQEEVLAQQRAEQQRLAAQNCNPDAPVDPASFIQTLPPGLRQQVLADMDDSLLALLPAELASEAHSLRRELEARHRQMQERFFSSHGGTALSRILRSAAGRMGTRYTIHTVPHHRGQWTWNALSSRGGAGGGSSGGGALGPPSSQQARGRQLLDHEALACLLVLLFVDEPRLNTGRLHRVLRNLCYHPPTRHWVVKSLLSILEKTKENKPLEAAGASLDSTAIAGANAASPGSQQQTARGKKLSKGQSAGLQQQQPSWLSISLDAALGCRTSVFQIVRHCSSRRPCPQVTIHPQASPVVCRHVLDTLISLAKSFPVHFLPEKVRGGPPGAPSSGKTNAGGTSVSCRPSSRSAPSTSGVTSPLVAEPGKDGDFWSVLVRLDCNASGVSAGKRTPKAAPPEEEGSAGSFESSPLAQLISLLAHPVVKRSSVLTDRLLRLLALVSMAIPDQEKNKPPPAAAAAAAPTPAAASTSNNTALDLDGALLGRATEVPSCSRQEQQQQPQQQPPSQPQPQPQPHHPPTVAEALASSVAAASAAAAAASSTVPPVVPTAPVAPTPVAPTPLAPTPLAPTPVAPAPTSQAPAASAPAAEKAAPSKPMEVVAMEDDSPHVESVVLEQHLKLAVETLTSKACSEEGLEDATSLLVRLSRGCPSARQVVLRLLLEGARSLGATVETSIAALLAELRTLNARLASERLALEENERDDAYAAGRGSTVSSPQPGTSGIRTTAGTIQDRFTHSTVVITAPGGSVAGPGGAPSSRLPKGGRELQLPSMGALTSKMSSQAFFLRVLKVVIQLREAAQGSLLQQQQQPARRRLSGACDIPASAEPLAFSWSTDSFTTSTPLAERTACPVQPNANNHMDVDGAGASGSAAAVAANGQNASAQQPLAASTPTRQNSVPAPEAGTTDEPLPLSEELRLDSLWSTLSDCLLELAETQDQHAVLVLQPAVEAFFLVHASAPSAAAATGSSATAGGSRDAAPRRREYRSESRETQLAHIHQEMAPLSPLAQQQDGQPPATPGAERPADANLHPDVQKFLGFAETHRTVLNQILRQSSTPLADGPFAVLVDHTRVLDFDVKRRYFRHELERLDEGSRREDLAVHVRREHVFEDSFRELHRRPPEEWKNRFYIVFEGEEGQDAGGLLREWYTIISREIFNPMYALFTTSPGDRVTYMINPASHCNSNHLSYFKFVGRVIAKAVYDNKLLECYFTRSFYKHILGKPVKYTDMESEDYSFYQGLVFLLEHGVRALGYELTFSVEVQEFGVTEVRDLKPGGRHLPVTEETTQEYVRLVCQEKMTGAIRRQLNAFLEGFYEIIPKRLIGIFNEQELELLISGLPSIDVDDLRAHTEYHKYQATSLQIQWFWRALRSMDQADRAKFLQFVTGTSKVPLQGFAALEGMNGVQRFQIHRDDRSTDRLPSAHTCFNQLDLPAYETYDKLRTMLLKAIQECTEGFGFA